MSDTTPPRGEEPTPLADETAKQISTGQVPTAVSSDPADHSDTAQQQPLPPGYEPVSASDHVAPEAPVPATSDAETTHAQPAAPALAEEPTPVEQQAVAAEPDPATIDEPPVTAEPPAVEEPAMDESAAEEPAAAEVEAAQDEAATRAAPEDAEGAAPAAAPEDAEGARLETATTEESTPEATTPEATTAPAEPAPSAPAPAVTPTPVPGPGYVQAPVPPKRKSNRGIGILLAVLGAVVFAVLDAGVTYGILLARYGENNAQDYLVSYLQGWEFWVPLAVFTAAFIALVAIVNRAGWWTYVLGSIFVGALVFVSYFGAALLTNRIWERTPGEFREFLNTYFQGTIPYVWIAVAVTFVALEVVIWFGALIAARGQSVKRRNAEAKATFEAEHGSAR